MKKVIIAVAPVAAEAPAGVHNPLTPEEIAADVISAGRAGASMVHLHVRDRQGKATEDLTEFGRTLDLIRQQTDIVIQGSTGGVSTLTLDQRCVSLNDPRAEIGTLNMGSVNFDEGVYINTLPDIRYWARRMKETQVLPELEIFEAGMINNVLKLADEGVLAPPFLFAFCLGFHGAMPASTYHLQFLRGLIPENSVWGLTHHGMADLSLLAAAAGMGAAMVRVGFEDSFQYAPGKIARTNTELVAKIAAVLQGMGLEIATPQEARQIFGLSNIKL